MRTLFVVTTKSLPVECGTFTLLPESFASSLNVHLLQNILVDVDEYTDIASYFSDFSRDDLSDHVRSFLRGKSSVPVWKRQVGDSFIYVAPCLANEVAGYGDEASHDYVGILTKLAETDMGFDSRVDQIYVLAHDTDLTFSGDPRGHNRYFEQKECLCASLKDIPDRRIYIFQHEQIYHVYSRFISQLGAADDTLLSACENMVKFFNH